MAPTKKYEFKLDEYKTAIDGFKEALQSDISSIQNPVVLDTIRNGKIQKFEYCTELMWKTIRSFLINKKDVLPRSAKSAVKEFFLAGIIDLPLYERLFNMIEDRNELSHVYNEGTFEKVFEKLDSYCENFFTVYEHLLVSEKSM